MNSGNTKIDFALGYGEIESYTTVFWISLLASIAGLIMTAYWVFTKSKTTEEIDNKVKISDEDEELIIAGSVLGSLGSLVVFIIIYLNHRENKVIKDSTFVYLLLYLQHVITFSVLLGLTFIYANFANSPTDNIPKVYLEQILIISAIALIFIIFSGWKYYFSEFDLSSSGRNKNIHIIIIVQHIINLVVVLSSVIISGIFLNSGNIDPSITTGLAVASGIGLGLTIFSFMMSYTKSIKNYKDVARDNRELFLNGQKI